MSEKASCDPRKIEISWQQNNDAYLPKVEIYDDASMMICVGGMCCVRPVKIWHESEKDRDALQKKLDELTERKRSYKCPCGETTVIIEEYPNHFIGCIVHDLSKVEILQKKLDGMRGLAGRLLYALQGSHLRSWCRGQDGRELIAEAERIIGGEEGK